MPKKRNSKKLRVAKAAPSDHVLVSNKSYGKALRGTPVYWEGKRPEKLQDDGSISFGKHILETLKKKFARFRWIITADTDAITTEYGIVRVRTSQRLLGRMGKENWDRSRDIKNDIVRRFFAVTFPTQFPASTTLTYVPGTLAGILDAKMVPRLSTEDKEALNAFLPDYVAAEAVGTVDKLKASAQIKTLKELASNLEDEMSRSHPEAWWQSYIRANIRLIQQGYIKALEKLNVAMGETKFPDFCLVTHDNYLDILEIKKPDTALLKHDSGRDNFYWDAEMAKAISQTENYIEQVATKADALRTYLLDREKINVKAVRPRGIILAGDARVFSEQKQRDDYRLLSQGIKNITVVTYDELLTRLNNYIAVLEEFSDASKRPARRRRRKSVH
jgi:hypothetical protein